MNALILSPARARALALWRDYPREVIAMGGIALAGMVAVGGSAWSSPNLDAIAAA
jgi:hypothetical protein